MSWFDSSRVGTPGLDAGQQALLVLAYLRYGDTYTRLAAGFRIGVAVAWRYVHEAVDLLAATAPTPALDHEAQ
jgi:hypothetical protein